MLESSLRNWGGARVTAHTSGHRTLIGAVTGISSPAGDGDPKPSKGLGSNPDLELLLRSSQPEEGDNEAAEEDFVAQG